ncbi:MAG: 2Fe-2S iron-sulfur cluster-binding protein [Lachnospiraceae bacterium]|nr:2Fe-2S iron-sulfur cluster-binding protein [Lachnospiraceae bacterium]
MTAAVRIKRNGGFKTYQVEYTPDTTIAKILDEINETEEDPIAWDCSCRQKMCGNCAMLINRRPALACITFLKDLGNVITLEPSEQIPADQRPESRPKQDDRAEEDFECISGRRCRCRLART